MYSKYSNPLLERYASEEMMYLFSPMKKFTTWRKLWVELARCEMELGLGISPEQIAELESNVNNIDFEAAKAYEKKLRHDVMAHVHAYGDVCPNSRGIIHLGATSAYVGDNTDLIQYVEGLELIKQKMAILLSKLGQFALEYKDLPTLGFTHFQPAQLTTVGKRAALWMQDFVLDYEDCCYIVDNTPFRGVKGTTGTQASFLSLFEGDHEKVRKLDQMVSEKFGFKRVLQITGQTYTRKLDSRIAATLGSIAQSLHKMTNDLRLLQHLKEIEEPFEKNQIGSSAMAYKRNPMRSERISSLAKFVITASQSPQLVQATQWFERTLDDSANKRLALPESFLAIDACLDIAINVTDGLVVYEKMIRRHIDMELPFMMTENILMEAVKKGGDRQDLHEAIRLHSLEAARMVKMEGLDNDLLERIAGDDTFGLTMEELTSIMDPALYTGRAAQQVVEFMESEIQPILKKHENTMQYSVDLKV